MLALEEVKSRKPETEIILFGWKDPPETSVPFKFLGIASAADLAHNYNKATVGLNISLTNYSRIPQEMMACGLPVVELSGLSAEAIFGSDGKLIELAKPDPISIADSLVGLLEDKGRRNSISKTGIGFVKNKTWEASTESIVDAIREELGKRSTKPT